MKLLLTVLAILTTTVMLVSFAYQQGLNDGQIKGAELVYKTIIFPQ
jgi:hypothetical protein